MTAFVTPDEQTYYRAAVIKAGLKLIKVGLKPGRGWNKTNTLAAAAVITGVKKYRRVDIDNAIADLDFWLKQRQSPIIETTAITLPQ
jgi:hypothetical protein